ncbi:hypothetical protein [Paraconexibacter sp. AEG42_29]
MLRRRSLFVVSTLAGLGAGLAVALPAAAAVRIEVSQASDGRRTLTIVGTSAVEKIRVRAGQPESGVKVIDVLTADIAAPAPGCRRSRLQDGRALAQCLTGSDARLVANLGGGGDELIVEATNDALGGAAPVVDVHGDAGNDHLEVNDSYPVPPSTGVTGFPVLPVLIAGDADNDQLSSRSAYAGTGGAGRDLLGGSPDGDTLSGGDGDDKISGGNGDDSLVGGRGGDDIDGNGGLDVHSYDGSTAVTVTLDEGCDDGSADDVRAVGGPATAVPDACLPNGVDRDRIRTVETVIGTAGDDTLVGSNAPERLFGGGGNDTLEGGGGLDDLIGEGGVDTLLARDATVDGRLICGDAIAVPVAGPGGISQAPPATPGDRAVVDADDVVSTSCAIVQRGGAAGPAEPPAIPITPSPGAGTPPAIPVTPPATPGGTPPATPGGTPPATPGGTPTTPGTPPATGGTPAAAPGASPPPPGPTPGVAPATVPASFVTGLSGSAEPGAGPGGGRAGRPPELRLVTRAVTADALGRVALRLTCVYDAKECRSRLTLTATRFLKAVQVRKTRRGRRVVTTRRTLRIAPGTVLGRAQAQIPWGRSAPVRITLTPRFRALLAASPRAVSVRLTVTATDSAQATGAATATLRRTLPIARRAASSRA